MNLSDEYKKHMKNASGIYFIFGQNTDKLLL
jgi:hypothetical protein